MYDKFPREKIIEILDKLETLKDIKDVSYSLNMFKQTGVDKLYVSAAINIQMLSEHSAEYIDSIRECHDRLEGSGFEHIRVESGNNINGLAKSTIFGDMYIQ
jgi:hypothetical protein